MQRRRVVRPDMEDGTLSLEGLAGEMAVAATLLDFAGGVITVMVQRAPTGVPGEMVTLGALIEWKDRTDAKPQPESRGPEIAQQRQPEPVEPSYVDEPEPVEHARAAHVDDPDAEALAKLEDEDVSSIPAAAR